MRIKRFGLKFADVTNYLDALFDPTTDDSGYVLMLASPKGRDHINSLFPQAHIEWHDPGEGFPSDWRGVSINLADVVAATRTHLPLDLMPSSYTVDDCSQDQLAFILAIGVKRAGGRAGRIDYTKRKPRIEIYLPQDLH
jgi:hypothetical protein